MARMEAKYGEAKYCPDGGKDCRDEVQLKTVLENSRNYDELLDAWKGWHRPGARACARTTSASSSWRTKARVNSASRTWARCGARATTCPPDDFTKEAARLYEQVKPLYKELHCYARAQAGAEVRRGQGAGRQADPGAPARQHVGAAVERASTTICSSPTRACSVDSTSIAALRGAEVGRGAHDEIRRELLPVDRLPGAARDVLGTLDADAPARPRRACATRAPGTWTARTTCASRCASSPTRRSCTRSITSSATSITTSGTRTSRSCSRTARTTVSTRPSATP